MIEADTTSWGTYQRGGIVVQVKQPKSLAFKTLEQVGTRPAVVAGTGSLTGARRPSAQNGAQHVLHEP